MCLGNGCKWSKSCSDVTEDWKDFEISIYDELVTSPNYTIHEQDMLVEGSTFGETNTCYLAIFPVDNPQIDSVWYVGNVFMKKYYMVYDMTPPTEYGYEYL